ncbi:MAG: oxidoreductase [Candidatus Poribacteria bacterium]|nr:MAG: oxidoreductase [Candidatus Poribacteria bacterium]
MALNDWGIGIAGLGGIAEQHLQGYRHRGLKVVAGAEPNPSRRQAMQERHRIPRVYSSVEEMVADEEVRVVDITVPHLPQVRIPVVEAAARAGKALFVQKPMMPLLRDGRRIVQIAEEHGVPLMVNQNSLFVPAFQRVYRLLQEQAIGRPYYCQIENRSWSDFSSHPWFGKNPRWITSDMGVHHYALIRHWFGPVETVYAINDSDPTQTGVVGDTYSVVIVQFASGVQATVINNWCYRGTLRRPHSGEEVVVQGDGGTLTATSQWLEVVDVQGKRSEETFQEGWFPHAFGYAMEHFIRALDEGRPFWSSGRENLEVLEIIEAAYRSVADRRVVWVRELR